MFNKKMKVKSPEEIVREKAKKAQEEWQEKIVILAREKIVPELKLQNKTIPETRLLLQTIAVAIQQGQYEVMKKFSLKDLKLEEKITDDYSEKDRWLKMLEILGDVSMLDSIEVLQWMDAKIDSLLKLEQKERLVSELPLDF